jgi:hypothetical protein
LYLRIVVLVLSLYDSGIGHFVMIDLKIQGNPDWHDSFVACICGILNSWEKPVDYATVAGFSGVAFSPVYDVGEDCRAWWMEGGNDIRIDFLGKVLGFSVEKIERKWTGKDEAWVKKPDLLKLPENTADYFKKIKDATRAGKAVLVNTWPTWSVISNWSEDVTRLPFETFSPLKKLVARAWPPAKTGLAYILTPVDPSLGRDEAYGGALAFGAKIAQGSIASKRLLYGGSFYRAVAERLYCEPFCVPCGDASYGCGLRTVKRVLGSVTSAVDFLELSRMSSIADHYRSIQELLDKYQDSELLRNSWRDRKFRHDMKSSFFTAYDIHCEAAKELHNV